MNIIFMLIVGIISVGLISIFSSWLSSKYALNKDYVSSLSIAVCVLIGFYLTLELHLLIGLSLVLFLVFFDGILNWKSGQKAQDKKVTYFKFAINGITVLALVLLNHLLR